MLLILVFILQTHLEKEETSTSQNTLLDNFNWMPDDYESQSDDYGSGDTDDFPIFSGTVPPDLLIGFDIFESDQDDVTGKKSKVIIRTD